MKFYSRLFIALLMFIPYSCVHAFEFSAFADIVFKSGDDEENNFALGEAELLTEHNLSDKTYAILDLLFKAEGSEIETEIERLSINRVVDDAFEIGVGRYMEPLGFWNHNFSHGSLAQHTISRPYLISAEEDHKGFLPTHLVGLLMRGDLGSWTYQFAVANGDGIDSTNPAATPSPSGSATVESLNNESPGDDVTLLIRTTYLVMDSLELGLTASTHNFIEIGSNGLVDKGEVLFEQSFAALDFNFNLETFYLFGEYYFMQFDDNPDMSPITANADTYDASVYYIQAGYRATETLTLVTRYESLDFDDGATIFAIQNIVPQTHTIIGFNYALEPSNSIRFEAKDIEPDTGESETIYSLQWFFYLL